MLRRLTPQTTTTMMTRPIQFSRSLVGIVTTTVLFLFSFSAALIVIQNDDGEGSVNLAVENATTGTAAAATTLPPTSGRQMPPLQHRRQGQRHDRNSGGKNIIRFNLRPTSSLIEERRRQRRRRLGHSTTNTTRNLDGSMKSNNSDSFNEQLQYLYNDFMSHRHLSRYERQLRTLLGIDIYPNWHGNYSVEEDSAAWNIQQQIETISNSHNNTSDHHRRKLLQSLLGGTFDRYQGVPLSQGFGTHYVHLWVGSPVPQRQSVIVDTGSHFTGFPVKGCQSCGESHHTDPHFDPSKSSTFQPLKCPQECLENFSCDHYPYETKKTLTDDPQRTFSKKNNYQHQQKQKNPPGHQQNSRRQNSRLTTLGQSMENSLMNEDRSQISRCKFKQAYTEGSSWVAYQARDRVYCGGGENLLDAVDESDTSYVIPFVFGCLQENSGLFITQLADGIMGMSAHELTLPKQLYNAGKLEYNMFAMCFRKETGVSKRGITAGSMTLGGVSSTLDSSPMVYARNTVSYGWFTPYVQNIYVARNGGDNFLFDTPESTTDIVKLPMDDKMVNVGRGVIVDSGTTDTYINSSVQPAFVKIWKQVTGMPYTHSPMYLTKSQLRRLPTLLIQMQAATDVEKASVLASYESSSSASSQDGPRIHPVVGQVGHLDPQRWNDVLLAIPATRYMEYSPTLRVYSSRLFFTETRGGVLGANAMQEHNVLFDWHHGRIGFARSSCEYDLIAGRNDNHANFVSAEAYHTDCILAVNKPILSRSCVESVDVAICEASDHPTNVEIGGTEVWTLMVESAGEFGSCERAMEEWVESQSQQTVRQIDPSVTNCTNDGICQEFRPCVVPCMDAIQYHDKKKRQKVVSADAVTIPHKIVSRTKAANVLLGGDMADDSSMAFACEGWVWSTCDLGCKQTRVFSSTVVTHQNGQYCIEGTREQRHCHIESCGRSDPCTVPFLVHAIFVLEGKDGARRWTPAFQDIFRKELMLAAHANPGISPLLKEDIPLFGEGDIQILATRPWYGDDDEEFDYIEPSKDGSDASPGAVSEGTENEEEPLGIQLILQISISNPNAYRRVRADFENDGRKLLQEVGVIWSNFTQAFRNPQPASSCDPIELYPLAKVANDVATKIIPHPLFAASLVHKIQLFDNARVISSWTIGTQVYDESINFLGPLASTPFFLLVRFLHEAFILMVIAWTGMSSIALFRRCKRFFCLRSWRKCQFNGYTYELVVRDEKGGDCYTDSDEDSAASISNDTFLEPGESLNIQRREIEMSSSARYGSPNGIKRRNSAPIEQGLDLRVV